MALVGSEHTSTPKGKTEMNRFLFVVGENLLVMAIGGFLIWTYWEHRMPRGLRTE